MLRSKCREAKSMAAFHFTMEADIKKGQQKLEVLQVRALSYVCIAHFCIFGGYVTGKRDERWS